MEVLVEATESACEARMALLVCGLVVASGACVF